MGTNVLASGFRFEEGDRRNARLIVILRVDRDLLWIPGLCTASGEDGTQSRNLSIASSLSRYISVSVSKETAVPRWWGSETLEFGKNQVTTGKR